MNRLQYRIVFNKKRGQLMAVAETASSQSKGSGQSRRRRRGAGRGPRGAAGTLALLALSSLGALWPAQAQIQADPNAPKNQQPTVLSTANGVPLVNIQTPSSAGVSRNTYSQFDVRANGAVLNNARSDAATQLGGWVQGNPWLAKGGARVILNEVNSSQPSQLRGYVEIAGQKAELIIANPAGIQVDGAGFINASSATLTTGLPRWQAGGQITGYAVQGGLISVDGKGLDASQTDYTALLARAAAVNAGIWAKALRITTGANLISADHAETTPTAGTGHAPSFALDVSALGGMYAGGKIVLLGTEHGVGVRNAGTLGALGGELTLTVDGRLYNSGTLQSSTHTRLQAREGVSNAGTVSATGELGIATEADIDNAGGTLNAARIELGAAALRNRGGSIEQTGTQALRLSGALLTNREAGQIGVSAAAESGSGSEETAAPTQGDNTPAAPPAAPPVPQPDAGASDGGSTAPAPVPLADGVIAISGPLDNDGGRIHAGGAIDLKAGAGLNNDAGRMGLRQLTLGGGELGNRGGSLSIAGTAAITASTLNNDAGQLSVGGPLRMTAGQLSNRAGQIILSGTEATELPVAAEFDNTDGTLASSASALTLRAGRLANERGRILHAGQQGLTIEAQTLLGQAGTIETPGALSLRAGQLDHRAASLTAAQLSLSADTFDNRGGSVQADAGLQIQAGSQLNNGEGGKILAALGSLAIEGQAELSNGGLIAARDGLALQARQLTQLQGAEISGQALRLQLQGRLLQDDSTASLLASRDLTLEAGSIALKQGLVQAGGRLDLVADTQAELGGRLHAGTALQVRSAGDITVGGMLSAQQQLILKTAAHLEAAPTALLAAGMDANGELQRTQGLLQIQAGQALAVQGQLTAAEVQLQAPRIDLHAGRLLAGQQAVIQAEQALITEAAQLYVGQLQLQASDWQHAGGRLEVSSAAPLSIALAGLLDNRQGLILVNSASLALEAQRLDNAGGLITSSGDLLRIQGQRLDNQGGAISSVGALKLQAATLLNNRDGQLEGQAVQITGGSVSNLGQGLISARGTLNLNASQLDNAGSLQSQGDATLIISSGALNNSGLIYAQGTGQIQAAGQLTHSGTVAAQGGLTVSADSIASSGTLAAGLKPDNSLAAQGDLTLSATQTLQHSGTALAAGRLDMQAATLQLQDSKTQAQQHIGLLAQSGELRLDRAVLASAGALTLNSATLLNTEAAQLSSAGSVDLTAQDWRHAGGALNQTDAAGRLNATLTGTLDNQGGRIAANGGALSLSAEALDNRLGQIGHAGAGELRLQLGQLAGAQGQILAKERLTLTARGAIDLDQAQTQARHIALEAGASLSHRGGQLLGLDGAQLDVAGALDNQEGLLQSTGDLRVQAAELRNHDGQIDGRDVRLTSAGHIANTGRGLVQAQGSLRLNASQLDNAGSLQSQGDATLIISSGALNNSGLIYAQGTGLLQVGTVLTHSGTIAAQGGLTVSADSIASSGTLAAGLKPDNSLAAQGDLTLSATQTLQHSGTALAAGRLDMQAATLQLQDSQLQGQPLTLKALSGELRLDRAQLASAGALTLSSATLLNTEAAALSAATASLTAQDWQHAGGQLTQLDTAGSLRATVSRKLDNRAGRISANGQGLTLSAPTLDNSQGEITHAAVLGHGELKLDTATLTGVQGQILAKHLLTLNASGAIDLSQAQTQAQSIQLSAASLNHQGGQLLSLGDATLTVAGDLDNRAGLMQAGSALTLKAATLLDNRDGQLEGQAVQITGGSVSNLGQGLISARGTLSLNASQLDNAGSLQSQGDATLIISSGALNNSGLIYAQGTGLLQVGTVLTHSGTIAAQGGLTVSADSIASSGTLAAGLKPDNSLAAQGDLTLSATQTLQHSGTALAAGQLDMQAATLQLQDSQLQGQPLTLKALSGELRLDRAQLASAGALTLSSATLLNTEAAALSAATASLTAQDWQHAGGQLTQLDTAGSLRATVSRKLDNREGRISANGQGLTLSAPTLDNSQGEITHAAVLGHGELKLDTATLTGVQGQILAKHLLTLNASGAIDLSQAQTQAQSIQLSAASLNHQGGQLLSLGDATLTVAGDLDNRAGLMQAGSALTLKAATLLDNRDGQLEGQAVQITGGSVSNLGQGLISARGTLSLNASQLDNAGSLQSQGDATLIISSGALNNSGLIYAQGTGQIQAAGQLTHSGTIAAQGGLTVSADSIASSGTLAAGLKPDNSLAAQGDLTLSATQTLQHSGTALAAGQLSATAAQLQLHDSQLQGQSLTLKALSGELRLDRAQLASAGALTLSSATLLNTEAAALSAATASLTAQDWQHAGGQLTQLDTAGSLRATVSRKLDNRAGRISANGQGLTLSAPTLDNTQGEITHAGAGELKLDTATLTGVQGQILAKHLLTLNASGAIDLSQAQTQAQTISLTAASLKHQAGQLLSLSDATLTVAGLVNNTAGQMQAANALNVHAATLDNRDGQLDGQSLLLQGGSLSNLGQGLITARGPLTVNATQLDNAGSLQSQGEARLTTTGALSNSGLIYAQGTGQLQSGGLLSNTGTVAAQGALTVSADSIASSGTFAAGLKPDNTLATQGDLSLTASQTLQHSGTALAAGQLDVRAASLQLQDSQLQAHNIGLQALSGELRLDRAALASATGLTLNSATLLNTEAAQLSSATVGLSAQDWRHAGGQLTQLDAAGSLNATVSGLIDNRSGQIAANGLALNLSAQSIDNSQGEITHAAEPGSGELKLATATLTGVQGQILARGALTLNATGAVDLSQAQTQAQTISLTAASLKHQAGQLLSLGDATLAIAGTLDNTAGQMQAATALNLQAAVLNNRDGQLDGQSLLLQGGSVSNLGQGLITARGPLTLNATQLDNAGSIQSQANTRIDTSGALSNSGLIYAQGTGLLQVGGALTHSGTVAAQGALTVSADSIASSGTFAAGLKPDNTLAAQGDLSLTASQTLQHSGTALAAGKLDMQAAALQLQDSQLQGQQLALNAQAGELRLDRATLASTGALSLASSATLNTEGAQLSAATVSISAQDWHHAGGALSQTDAAGRLDATVAHTLDNRGGQIAANGSALNLAAQTLDNTQGEIVHAGSGELKLTLGQLDGSQGQILAKNLLTLNASGAVNLSQAQTQAQSINLTAASLNHQGGQLLSLGDATLSIAGTLDNTGGLMQATTALNLQAAALNNRDGQLDGQAVQITGGSISNLGQGLITARGPLTVTASQLDNAGSLQSQGDATLIISSGALNNSGLIYAQGTGLLQVGTVLTHSGTIAAQGGLTVSADSIASSGTLAAGLKPDNSLAAQGDLTLSATQTLQHSGTALAAGQLDMQAATLQLQDSQLQGQPLTLKALSGELRLDRAQLASAGALTLSSATLLNTEAAALSAATASLTAQDWQHAGGQLTQLDTAGSLRATVSRKLDNREGRISANGQGLTLSAPTLDNTQGEITHAGAGELKLDTATLTGVQGQILAKHLLTLNASGAIDLSQAQTQAQSIQLSAASLNHQGGQLLSLGDATLTVAGDLDNQTGQLSSSGGRLQVQAATLDNRDGQLGGQSKLQLTSTALTRNGGQGLLWSQGALVLEAGELANAGGIQAQGDALLTVGGQLLNSGRIYSQGQTTVRADSLVHTGLLAAQGALDMRALTSIASSGGFAAGLRPDNSLNTQGAATLSLTAGQALQHSGSLLAAGRLDLSGSSLQLQNSQTQAGAVVLSASTGELRLDSAKLTSAAGLSLVSSQATLNTEGAQLSAAGTVGITAQHWHHAGGVLSQTDAAGPLQATVQGLIDNRGGQISSNGATLTLNALQRLDNSAGGLISQASSDAGSLLRIQTGQLDGASGKILSAGALTLDISGGAANLSQAQTQAQRIHLSADSLNHQGGQMLSLGLGSAGTSTLNIAGRLDNRSGSVIVSDAGTLELAVGSLLNGVADGTSTSTSSSSSNSNSNSNSNSGGLLQSGGDLTLRITDAGGTLDNQGGRIRSGGHALLTAALIDNRQGWVGSDGSLTLKTPGELRNAVGTLWAQQGLALEALTLDNQKGRIASLKAGVSVRAQGLVDNSQQGSIVAEQTLDLAAGGLLNSSQGELSGTDLIVDTGGQALDNRGGRLLAKQSMRVNSGQLDNQGGLLQSLGSLSVDTHGAALLNTLSATPLPADTLTGIHAKGALTLSSGELLNSAGISSGSGLAQIKASQLNNRALISGETLQLTISGTLDNQGGRLRGSQALQAGAQQLLNQGGAIYGGQDLTLTVAGLIDNRDTGGSASDDTLGIQGKNLTLQAAQLDNRAGRVLANGQLQLKLSQLLDNNTGGLLSAQGEQRIDNGLGSLPTASALAVNNATGSIWSGQGLTLSARELGSGQTGRISSGGSLSLSLSGDLVYGGGGGGGASSSLLQAQGDTTLNLSGNFINQGTLRSGGALAITAAGIDNQAGAELSGTETRLSASASLSNRGLIDGGRVTLDAGGQLLNIGSGRLYGDSITLTAASLANGAEAGQAAVIAARQSLDAQLGGELSNRDGALIFADGTMQLAANSLLNENASIEASSWLRLDTRSGAAINRSLYAEAEVNGTQDPSNPRLLASKAFISSGGDMHISGASLVNSGATVEARGNLTLQAAEIQNLNPYLKWQQGQGEAVAIQIMWYEYDNRATIELLSGRTVEEALAHWKTANPFIYDVGYSLIFDSGGAPSAVVTQSLAGHIIVGGQLDVQSGRIRNDMSRVIGRDGVDITAATIDNISREVQVTDPNTSVVSTVKLTLPVSAVTATPGSAAPQDRNPAGNVPGAAGAQSQQAQGVDAVTAGPAAELGSALAPNAQAVNGSAVTASGAQVNNTWRSADPGPAHTVSAAGQPAGTGATAQTTQRQGAKLSEQAVTSAASGIGPTLARAVLRASQAAQQQAVDQAQGSSGAGAASAQAALRASQAAQQQAVDQAQGSSGAGSARAQATLREGQGARQQAVDQAQTDIAITAAMADMRQSRQLDSQALPAAAQEPPELSAKAKRSEAKASQAEPLQGAQAMAVNASAQAPLRESSQTAQAVGAPGSAAGQMLPAPGQAGAGQLPGGSGHAAAATALQPLPRGGQPTLRLPSNSLFKQHTDPSARYLVETDPRFANYRDWLSSDYLLQAMEVDPATTQKRLGDGYYEQRLVREQIGQLTGTSFLPGYASDEDMYRALLSQGASFAQAHQLRPGVALSAELMAQLTTDLVWLVEQEVTLADGRRQRVLVPQVYLLPREGDLEPSGALIAGGRVDMVLSGAFNNSGTVRSSGGGGIDIEAQDIHNTGRLRGGSLALTARDDLRNIGGELSAEGDLRLNAGRDIVMTSTLASGGVTGAGHSSQRTVLDQVARLSAGGVMVLQAGRDVELQAAQLVQQGGADTGTGTGKGGGIVIQAGRDLKLSTLQTHSSQETVHNANNYKKQSQSQDVGTQILAQGAVILQAAQDIKTQAAAIQSEEGGIALDAGRDVQLLAGQALSIEEQAAQSKKRSGFKKRTSSSYSYSEEATALGTTLSAGQGLSITAGAEIQTQAATLAAGGAVQLRAQDIQLDVAQSSREDIQRSASSKRSGLHAKGSASSSQHQSQTASQVSSISGASVLVVAQQDLTLVGARVSASAGDAQLIAGRDLQLLAAQDSQSYTQQQQSKKSGLSMDFMNGMSLGSAKQGQNGSGGQTTVVGSQISGTRVLLQSGRDTTLTAATVLADRDISVDAGRHLSILAAQQSQQSDSSSQRSGTSIGVMPGLSARFTLFGQNAAAQDGSQHASESVTSALSATGGNLSLKAGTAGAGAAGSGTVTVQGADLLAQDRVSIRGTEVDLQAVANKSAAQSHTQSKATTVGAALTGTVGSLLTKISDQIETARHTDDDRLQAAAALKAGYDAYKLGSALASEGGAANLAEGVNSGAAIGVSISMNVSKSRSDSQQSQSQVRGSNIQAGSIAIQATQGDISAQSAKLQAQSISLDAKRDILLGAAANQSDIKSSNKSSSVGGGVTLGVGEQSGISFQLSASQTKGRVNGSETVYDNSQLIASDSLQLKSGRDTTLAGAQLGGDQVKLDVGGDLKLQTLQDQSLYDSKQSTSGFNLSVCVPPICAGTFVTGSINIAKQTISQNYLSAVGQSGITAGSQGFDIRVGGHTDLQGAAITSSAEDKDKNRLQTGSLSSADLANHQHTSAKSMSVSVGYQGASTGATLVANAVTNVLSNALGQAGLPKNKHEQSQTQSVISPARITITSGDAASQETATQLTSRDASTANQSLTNTFGLQQAQAVEAELNKQRAAKQAMQELAKDFAKEIGDHAAGKIEEAKALELRAGKEPDQAKSAELRQQAQQLRSDWGDYGTLRVAAHTALGGLTGDLKGAAGALAGTLAAPAVAEALDKAGVNAVLTTQLTRLVSTAAGAAVGGTAGGAAARNEVENNYLSHKQWNDLAQERANCKGDTRCEKRVEQDYAKLSKAQDAVLATCDVRGDCAKLIGEVDAGRQRQLDLVKSGQLPDNFLGAYDLQSMGQKLATDTTLRGKVAQAVTTQLICDTNRALCDERSAKAAGGLVLTLAGVGAAAQLIKNVPALAAAAGMTVETCMSSLVLCASRVGVAVADLMAGDALGGASLAAGTLAAGKVAGKLTGKLADEAADAARNAAKVAEEAAALKAIAQNNNSASAKIDNSLLNRSDVQLTNDLAARAKVRPDTSNDAFYATNTDQTVLKANNFDMGHVLSGEINANGRATGYHAEFAADGAARIKPGGAVTQNANGTYEAPVQIWDQSSGQWMDKARESTFFPPSWSEARVTYEVTEAFKNKTMVTGTMWRGTSPSGVVMQGYINQGRVTFYPMGNP